MTKQGRTFKQAISASSQQLNMARCVTTTFSLPLILICTMMISVSVLLSFAAINPLQYLDSDRTPAQITEDVHRWTIQTLEQPSQVEDVENWTAQTNRKPAQIAEDVKNQVSETLPESAEVGKDVENHMIVNHKKSEQVDESERNHMTMTLQKLEQIDEDVQDQMNVTLNVQNQTTVTISKPLRVASLVQIHVNEKDQKPAGAVRRKRKRKTEAKKTEFMLVTGERSRECQTSRGSYVMMMSYKNKIDYCNIHGCKVWYALEVWEPGFTGTWVRYPLLLKLMKANPTIKWFMWMDSDAIFTDFGFTIPIDTYEKQGKNLVVPGDPDKVYAANPDWISLNAGIFLIRNCEWSYNFLLNWKKYGDPTNLSSSKEALNSFLTRPKDWGPDDQSALVYLLNLNKADSQTHAYLEGSYTLHGYWKLIVDRYEEITKKKQRPPFVTHFCGCNFCGSKKLNSECYQGFWRAYNFADNQLLSRVSLSHPNLASSDPLLIAARRKSQ